MTPARKLLTALLLLTLVSRPAPAQFDPRPTSPASAASSPPSSANHRLLHPPTDRTGTQITVNLGTPKPNTSSAAIPAPPSTSSRSATRSPHTSTPTTSPPTSPTATTPTAPPPRNSNNSSTSPTTTASSSSPHRKNHLPPASRRRPGPRHRYPHRPDLAPPPPSKPLHLGLRHLHPPRHPPLRPRHGSVPPAHQGQRRPHLPSSPSARKPSLLQQGILE